MRREATSSKAFEAQNAVAPRVRALLQDLRWSASVPACFIYLIAALGTVALSSGPLEWSRFVGLAPFWIGLVFAAVLALGAGSEGFERRVLSLMWLTVLFVAVRYALFSSVPVLDYGDSNILSWFLANDVIPAKWLVGMNLLHAGYEHIWLASAWEEWVRARPVPYVHVYVALVSAMVVCIGNVALLRWAGHRFAVRLAMTAPFLFVLGAGYREYYPFIIGIYLLTVYLMIADQVPRERIWPQALLLGLLPAMYIGFIPLTLLFGAGLALRYPRKIHVVAITALCSLVVSVLISWPGSPTEFVQEYRENLQVDKQIPYQRYESEIAPGRSVFFRASYAISPEHAADLAFAGFYIGLGASVVLLAGALFLLRDRLRPLLIAGMRKPRLYLALVLCAQQMQYFVFMLPHFGPRHDIDVYFTVPIVSLLVAGLLWEKVFETRSEIFRRRFTIGAFSAVLGHGAALASILLVSGMPNVYRGMDDAITVGPEGGVVGLNEQLLAFDGASVVPRSAGPNEKAHELQIYVSFFTTLTARLEFAGTEPAAFSITPTFTQLVPVGTRFIVSVNGEPVGSWRAGGVSGPEGIVFQTVAEPAYAGVAELQPGANTISYRIESTKGIAAASPVHVGPLTFEPYPTPGNRDDAP